MLEINGEQYSIWVGLVYVFNLIVGTGALALPAVFGRAGWLLGFVVVLILAFISFITVTFVIESIASANAIKTWKNIQMYQRVGDIQDLSHTAPESEAMQALEDSRPSTSEDSEDTPLVPIERSERPNHFYIIPVYLYGDLSIYGTAIAKSVTDIACTYIPQNFTCNETIPDQELCWESLTVNRLDAYRIFLTVFIMMLGPFAFFNVQKTKYLQVLTSLMRWMAFSIMIIYAISKILAEGPQGTPVKADTAGLPGLFGVCVYSFMCHHSLPALIAPISDKSKLNRSISYDFILISFFYILLALTGVFAFEQLDDLYTLDFGPKGCRTDDNIVLIVIQYFLALFPVFTLSTSFPIIAITLRNNLQSLFLNDSQSSYCICLRKAIFPLLAVLPPYLIAMSTKNLTVLVSITGSFAGAGIQYVIPTLLVYNARKSTAEIIGQGAKNELASPFKSTAWLVFIILWAFVCMIFVSTNIIEKQQSIRGGEVHEYW
ncbi:transmembrane protein 104 homolog isoform X2 [Copidosoma floridanum]|uniref:transmembrane protein 104 homolog isoform X2 n=1 Tax=Copidosoma floridanum TaxID=29053 RepID=UPI0006C9AB52|nr:transmembrane protein 104 homolog isoform X2 [Copidosoma floridanum]